MWRETRNTLTCPKVCVIRSEDHVPVGFVRLVERVPVRVISKAKLVGEVIYAISCDWLYTKTNHIHVLQWFIRIHHPICNS